ncbi:MAG: MgtC/SapB family protein, partial [Oscillospiraceae bacterium]|nr:MgtC/SapB family protein [Oscillospiraceae bacterium]
MTVLNYLREANTIAVIFRLVIAMFFGGMIGLTRNRKGKAAGFRTYMLVCMGAALAMALGQYLYSYTSFLQTVLDTEIMRSDVTRLGAQVINGVGFLGAGTILVTRTKQVQGVTTAAGLWASACMGLAIGAGFYECVAGGFIVMLVSFLTLNTL